MRHILKIYRWLSEPISENYKHFDIRTFNPAQDKDEWLALNNKIFAHHPDQGGWVMEDLENRIREPWFDPEGFFLVVAKEKILGFCWTKIHHDLVNQEPVGELYVVGVDPDHAHQGIGRAVSIAALQYLVRKNLKQAMLYVDNDNLPGRALYKSLGFN